MAILKTVSINMSVEENFVPRKKYEEIMEKLIRANKENDALYDIIDALKERVNELENEMIQAQRYDGSFDFEENDGMSFEEALRLIPGILDC